MKFTFFNDTGRTVSIHPASHQYCTVDKSPIQPLEQRVFTLPDGTNPSVKMWDYGVNGGLQIFVSQIFD